MSHSGFLICKMGGNLVPRPSRIVSGPLPCPRPCFPHPHHGAIWVAAVARVAHPIPVCFKARTGHLTLPLPPPLFNILCCRIGPTVTARGHTDSHSTLEPQVWWVCAIWWQDKVHQREPGMRPKGKRVSSDLMTSVLTPTLWVSIVCFYNTGVRVGSTFLHQTITRPSGTSLSLC